jgi:hypothetical protein
LTIRYKKAERQINKSTITIDVNIESFLCYDILIEIGILITKLVYFIAVSAITMTRTNKKLFKQFIASLRILFIPSQIFGLMSFTATETYFRLSKLKIIVNILLHCIFLSITAYGIYQDMTKVKALPMYKSLIIFGTCCGESYTTAIWITSLINRRKCIHFLTNIFDFDTHTPVDRTIRNYQQTKREIIRRFLTKHFVLFVFLISHVLVHPHYRTSIFVTTQLCICFQTAFNSALCFQSVELTLMLKIRFATLNEQINDLIEFFAQEVSLVEEDKNLRKKVLLLGKISTLHHHLSKLIRLFNDTFGVSLLLMFGYIFIVLTISVFYITVELQASFTNWFLTTYSILMCSSYAVDSFYICHFCYSTVAEVQCGSF